MVGNATAVPLTSTPSSNGTTDSVDLMLPSSITLCIVTGLVLILSLVLLFLYYLEIGNKYTLDARTSSVLLFLGGLLATVTAVGTANNHDVILVYKLYVLGLTCVIGLAFTIVGSILFFESGQNYTRLQIKELDLRTVGHRHGSLGIVIWMVTIPLVILEFVIIAGVVKLEHNYVMFDTALRVTTTMEKLVQASVYYFSIRHRYPKLHSTMASKWFFQILFLYNFILWVDSVLTTSDDDKMLFKLYGSGFSILKEAYNALIIDYRMLCALLFLEHGLEIEPPSGERLLETAKHQRENGTAESNDSSMTNSGRNEQSFDQSQHFPETGEVISMPFSVEGKVSHYSGCGFLLGIGCVLVQALNGLQYLNMFGAWANLSGIAADLLVIVLGIVFLRINNLDADIPGQWRQSDSKGIDAMVGIMGGVGFTFWIMKSFMSSVLASYHHDSGKHEYLMWTSVKNCTRALGVLFQLYLFTRTSPELCTRRQNRRKLINHFLVPALMLCLFAVFATAIIDQYHGHVEIMLHNANLSSAVRFLLEAGDPIHLAFCLHMFLHFLIVRFRMVNVKVRVTYMMEETSVYESEGYTIVPGGKKSPHRDLTTPLIPTAPPFEEA